MSHPVPAPIRTPRLLLQPLDAAGALALVSGDFTAVTPGAGWPHADTMDGLAFTAAGAGIGWLVTLDGVTIGDCGTAGPVDESGAIELGYGLAEPYRGKGYGTELVAALSQWLLHQPGVRSVTANEVLAGNVASRRVLERAGFRLARADRDLVWYVLTDA